MTWIWILIVILIGLTLIALEIVVLPGGVSGICGGVMVIVGVWQSYVHYGMRIGNICLIVSLIAGSAMVVIFLKSKTWRRFSLKEEIDGQVNQVDENEIQIGTRGRAISRLAPSGNALINNKITEVHSADTLIDEGTEIEVVEIEGYKITVRRVEEKGSEE